MTEKELREIKRRFRPDKNNILSIKGCLVNREGNIVSRIDQAVANCSLDESEKLLSIMKKSISGSLGTNLLDIEFGARQAMESEQHKLLLALRDCALRDEQLLERFYSRVIESVRMDGGYVILLAHDNYDVYSYTSDGQKADSSELFSYIVCAVCPVKPRADGLYYREFDSTFRAVAAEALLSPPELGFMFPAFDDRAANIYNLLYYTKNIADVHPAFIESIFGVELPKSAAEQKENFDCCLKETLEDECDFETMRSVHSQIADMEREHKDTKQEEPLRLSRSRLQTVLEYCGVDETRVDRFGERFDRDFGAGAEVAPKSIVNTKKFELVTPDVQIKVNPDRTDLVSTQIIGGVRYIMIRANEGVEVNGVNIDIK